MDTFKILTKKAGHPKYYLLWIFSNATKLTFLSPLSRIASMSSSVISLSLEANTCVAPWRMMDSISSFPSLFALGSTSLPVKQKSKKIIWWLSQNLPFYFINHTNYNMHWFPFCTILYLPILDHHLNFSQRYLSLQSKSAHIRISTHAFTARLTLKESLNASSTGTKNYLAGWRLSPGAVSSQPSPQSSPRLCFQWWNETHAPASADQSCELDPEIKKFT